jgi:hypothetical protein
MDKLINNNKYFLTIISKFKDGIVVVLNGISSCLLGYSTLNKKVENF